MTRLVWVGLMVEAEAAERSARSAADFDREPTEALTRDLETAQRMPAQWAEGAPYAALARAELRSRPARRRRRAAPTRPRGTSPPTRSTRSGCRGPPPTRACATPRPRCWPASARPPGRRWPPPAPRARAMGALPLRRSRPRRSAAARACARTPTRSRRRPPPARQADPLGLTPRELEVLLLVAEGRTNKEIGATLFMSEKTASVHVSRILAKLDVGGRAASAVAAGRSRSRLGLDGASTGTRLAAASGRGVRCVSRRSVGELHRRRLRAPVRGAAGFRAQRGAARGSRPYRRTRRPPRGSNCVPAQRRSSSSASSSVSTSP